MNSPFRTKREENRMLKLARKRGFQALKPEESERLKREMGRRALEFEQSFREIQIEKWES